MIIGINHVQVTIPVGAEDQARKFYCDLLGLKEIKRPKSLKSIAGLWLQVGELQLHIGCENNEQRSQSKAHVAYETKDLNQLRQKFNTLGITISENIPIEGINRFDIRDPFGNRIEFVERLS